jgi:DNA-binding NarL/FixJ family response regulator
MTIRLVLVDDEPLIRAGLRMLMDAEPDFEVLAEAGDTQTALACAQRMQPDVVVMDVRMPGGDGVDATVRITADGFADDPDRPVKVLILTSFHEEETVYRALRAGATGFVLKAAAPRELTAAVRAVAAGDAWLDPAVARGLLSEFAARPHLGASASADVALLTPRERAVLVLAAHGLNNTEIAEQLVVAEATVKTHLGRVLMKLGVRDRTQAVVVAYRTGLVPVT